MPLVIAATMQPATTKAMSGTAAERAGEAVEIVTTRNYTRAPAVRNDML
jgi:hypothetical protein